MVGLSRGGGGVCGGGGRVRVCDPCRGFVDLCSAMQCSAVQYSAVQCSAQCSAVRSAVQCSAVQCSAMQCSAVQCSAVQCSAVQLMGLTVFQTDYNLFGNLGVFPTASLGSPTPRPRKIQSPRTSSADFLSGFPQRLSSSGFLSEFP